MYKHTGIGWISVQEKCLRIVSFLGTKSELMNVIVSCGWSRYATAVNRDTKILATKSWYNFPFLDISLFEKVIWCFTFVISCLQYFWCKFSINSCKIYEKYRNIYWEQKESHTIFPCLSILFNVNVVPALFFFFCRRWQGFPFTVSLSDFLCLLCIVGVRRPRRIRSGQRANGS